MNFLFNIFKIKALALPRSNDWKKLRKEHLIKNPNCAVCGSKKNVVPHHIIPIKEDPAKELDPENLITLCENKTFNCHLFFGHLKNWNKYNINVVSDAEFWRKKIINNS